MPSNLRHLAWGAALLAGAFTALPVAAQTSAEDKREARVLLEELISHRTAAGAGQVPVMVNGIVARLRQAGFAEDDIALVPVEKDGDKTVGLVVRLAGTDPEKKPIAILGHMDVVDALPANWQTDPYVPVERDGYIYGRGSVDNKAGISAVLATFMRLKREGYKPERTYLIAFSGDEETGMETTRALTTHPWVSQAAVALNTDAGSGSVADGKYNFSIQSAEKTFATFMLSATNSGGHSSAPRPDNAIYELAKALDRLSDLQFAVEFNEITRPMVAQLARDQGGELGRALETVLDDPGNAAARQVLDRYPEYTNILWTTCIPTMLSAGNAPNALPQNAVATINCRIFPGTSTQEVSRKISETIADPAIAITLDEEPVESPASPINEPLFAAITKAVHANYPGAEVMPSMSSGGTDGREFRRAGIPTYGAGSLALKRPDDNRAHGIDERVPIEAFYKELNFWDVLLRELDTVNL
ncbi:M20/M25/M40 family metallo-hydrolase [Croceicoccus sp. F390]|uniref:M20/M25/M40 family metallo-hydrolase n=1 Tax=Croceicoccus esteveae TaxID=3075597 RepID=A0ABU2ZHR2_9SPHN|nr:M20/M25/M40 family metallo-hydrolase [Croceicoccus sp. F390]MDT0575925.1 M20/M25/M40 family metallo-hydrolase [Croceicoccus sp. F390]